MKYCTTCYTLAIVPHTYFFVLCHTIIYGFNAYDFCSAGSGTLYINARAC